VEPRHRWENNIEMDTVLCCELNERVSEFDQFTAVVSTAMNLRAHEI
jgi:hypothetical protein